MKIQFFICFQLNRILTFQLNTLFVWGYNLKILSLRKSIQILQAFLVIQRVLSGLNLAYHRQKIIDSWLFQVRHIQIWTGLRVVLQSRKRWLLFEIHCISYSPGTYLRNLIVILLLNGYWNSIFYCLLLLYLRLLMSNEVSFLVGVEV